MTKRISKADALKRLQKSLNEIEELSVLQRRSSRFLRWHRDTRVAIRHIFGSESDEAKEFPHEHDFEYLSFGAISESERQYHYQRTLADVSPLLESMITQIRDYWLDNSEAEMSHNDTSAQPKRTKNTVFIVHGRDEGTKEAVARFIEKLGLEAVILHERSNEGHTIIEKLERHSQTAFAIVLLTPDDLGALREDKRNLQPRARQNVIFEFGYFIAKLGRNRVCALVKESVERPSDYDGVLYIPLDDTNGWKLSLSRELTSAGFNIDLNQAN